MSYYADCLSWDLDDRIFLDISVTFHTIDRVILLDSLRGLGAEDSVLHWFCSYHNEWFQCVAMRKKQLSQGLLLQHRRYGVVPAQYLAQ